MSQPPDSQQPSTSEASAVPIRAFTVRQPWAWSIMQNEAKDVENRSRNIAGAYRGLVAIHAGKLVDQDAYDFLLRQGLTPPPQQDLLRGHIIGVVDLVDVVDDHPSRWAFPDHHHLILAHPRKLASPLPYRGVLGLWTPDTATRNAIHAQIRELGHTNPAP